MRLDHHKLFSYTTTCPTLIFIAKYCHDNRITLQDLEIKSGHPRLKIAEWFNERTTVKLTPRYLGVCELLQTIGHYLDRSVIEGEIFKVKRMKEGGRKMEITVRDPFLYALFSEAQQRGYTAYALSRKVKSKNGEEWSFVSWASWFKGEVDPPFLAVRELARFLSYNLTVLKR